mmetsp:Transcript_5229/g.7798  ORF Transcript_5229/g.7798 Transcript_5229/m.7798 type:complete len:214 (-) Transcript_5229:1312-1953(-)
MQKDCWKNDTADPNVILWFLNKLFDHIDTLHRGSKSMNRKYRAEKQNHQLLPNSTRITPRTSQEEDVHEVLCAGKPHGNAYHSRRNCRCLLSDCAEFRLVVFLVFTKSTPRRTNPAPASSNRDVFNISFLRSGEFAHQLTIKLVGIHAPSSFGLLSTTIKTSQEDQIGMLHKSESIILAQFLHECGNKVGTDQFTHEPKDNIVVLNPIVKGLS